MSVQKGMPLTRQEAMQLVELVANNPVVYSKGTNASNNKLKEVAWIKITDSFNSTICSCPRTPEQLRLKWENMKKAARKRSSKIRMNHLKTGGGKGDYIPPDEALDKVAVILGATCEGYSVPFGGDAVRDVELDIEEVVVEEVVVVQAAQEAQTVLHEIGNDLSESQPSTSKKYFFNSCKSKGKLKSQALTDEVKKSIIKRNNALAEYYESKKRHDEDLYNLKRRKLEQSLSSSMQQDKEFTANK